MKTLKLVLLIAVIPTVLLLTTNCSTGTEKSEVAIDRFKKCLDSCEEMRNSADVEYQTCLGQAFDSYMRRVVICGNRGGGNDCLAKALEDYTIEKDRCELQWREQLAKAEKCRKLCYKDAVSRELP